MKRIYFYFWALCLMALTPSCKEEFVGIDSIPVLELEEPSNMGRSSITLNGSIRTGHPKEILEYGFLFGSTSDLSGPDTRTLKVSRGSLYFFSADVDNLDYGATYYYAVYAENGFERLLSETKAVTIDKASVILSDFEQVNNTRSCFSAHVADDGGGDIRRVGFCWSDEEKEPTIYEGEFLVAELDPKTKSFELSLPLEPTKIYYVRAFVQSRITEEESLTDAYSETIIVVPGPADNEIWYTSTDGEVVKPVSSAFDAKIISNTYENGRGVISFDKKVSVVGEDAFRECNTLSTLTFPDSIESVLEAAIWACENLSAFYGKYASKDNRCLIKDDTLLFFAPAGIKEYTIPDGITKIADASFLACRYLEKVVIPNSVTIIDSFAFHQCASLVDVDIPESVTRIEEYAFSECTSLEEVLIGKGVTYIGEAAYYNCEELKKVIIPESVTFIGSGAFMACTELMYVYCYPVTPPEIESSAFTSNPADRKIYVPNESLEAYKIEVEWDWLADSIYPMSEGEANATIYYTSTDGKIVEPYQSNVFGADIVSNTYVNGRGEIIFDAPVSKIGTTAFLGIENLKSIEIPNSVTIIEEQAFSQCLNLVDVYIPGSVERIARAAFFECVNLERIIIPEGVVTLGDEAFTDCTKLEYVSLPNTLKTMGEMMFAECTALETLTIPNSVSKIGEYLFFGCSQLKRVILGSGTAKLENAMFVDCENLIEVVIPEGVTTIGEGAFMNCNSLESILLPNTITTFEPTAFAFCGGLKSITIPDSVISLGDSAFIYCENLKEVSLGQGISQIDEGVFAYTGLEKVEIPDQVTFIGEVAFSECKELQEVKIGDGVHTIAKGAFYGCENLTNLLIGKQVTTILKNAFCGCKRLVDLIIPSNVKEIGEQAFWECYNLANLTIENGVETIGDAAFAECVSLRTVTIPESVTSIGGGVFHTASSLAEVYCYPTIPPTAGGVNMFKNNAEGRIIFVPEESVAAYRSAPYWSDYASSIYAIGTDVPKPEAPLFKFQVKTDATSAEIMVTPSDNDTRYYWDFIDETQYNSLVSQFGSIEAYMVAWFEYMAESYGLSVADVVSVFSSQGVVGPMYYEGLQSDTEYVIWAFNIDMQNGHATSSVETYHFKTLEGETLERDYAKWLGTWTVTSASSEVAGTPMTFNLTISSKEPNNSYYVYGWEGIETFRDYPLTGYYQAATDDQPAYFFLEEQITDAQFSTDYGLTQQAFMARFNDSGVPSIWGGGDVALVGVEDENQMIILPWYATVSDTDVEIDFTGAMQCLHILEGDYAGYLLLLQDDFSVGPYTLEPASTTQSYKAKQETIMQREGLAKLKKVNGKLMRREFLKQRNSVMLNRF